MKSAFYAKLNFIDKELNELHMTMTRLKVKQPTIVISKLIVTK